MNIILSTALFPPIPWFAQLLQAENNIIDTNETYSKQTFRNRFYILTSNGILEHSIPITKPDGNHTKTKDILIYEQDKNFAKILTSIETAYYSSPFFEYFKDELYKLFKIKYSSLVELCNTSIAYIENILRISINLQFAPEYIFQQDELTDLRSSLSPKNKNFQTFHAPPYQQVFSHKFSFAPNLSILDLIFNLGLESIDYLYNFPIEDFIKHINTNTYE